MTPGDSRTARDCEEVMREYVALTIHLAAVAVMGALVVDGVDAVFQRSLLAQSPVVAEGSWLVHGKGNAQEYYGLATVKAVGSKYVIHWELTDRSEMVADAFVDGDTLVMVYQDGQGRLGYGYYRANGSLAPYLRA